MKLATIALLGILLPGSFASLQASDKNSAKANDPAGAGEVALAFTGGSAYSDTGGTCIWLPVLLGDLDLDSLFESVNGAPAVDKEHAYLIWVSDFTAVPIQPFTRPPSSPGSSFSLQLVPTGTGTIYFSDTPQLRKWEDLTDRSSWGQPVATFTRKAGMFQSTDGGWSGTLTSSAELVSSTHFKLNGKTFNFQNLIPHGMTCLETGSGIGNDYGDDEVGTCMAIRNEK